MSQTASRPADPEKGRIIQAVTDDDPERSQPIPNQPPRLMMQGEFSFGYSSGPLFSLYSKIAEEEDNKMADRWKKDADGILIFTGLFSAAVAALLAVSIPDLRPNSQDISAFYLANIYQILANTNVTVLPTSIPSTIAVPPSFSPPTYAVWVNSLWFLSLVISLTCALLATSLQQWARRYIRITQPSRSSREKRARIRAFFADGVDKMHFPWAVEALPTLIHLSLFLFFIGLAIFLFNVNHSAFFAVIWWIGLFTTGYVWMTLMPIFRHDSPYYAPLSLTAWSLHASILHALFIVLAFITSSRFVSRDTWRRFRDLSEHYGKRMLGGVSKAAEEIALKQSSGIDLGILEWTIGAVGEDETLETFFVAIPSFFSSPLVKDLKRPLPDTVRSKFVDSFGGFLRRNLSSNSVSEEDKIRRFYICMNAAKAICDSSDIENILRSLFSLGLDQVPISYRTAEILTRWCTSNEHRFSSDFRRTAANIFLFVRERDERWIGLAKDQFGMPEDVLRDNIAHGDNSVLLAILIHVARQVIRTGSWNWSVLFSLSNFDIHNTVPGLRNEFCALWNDIVQQARNTPHPYVFILYGIRLHYIALHEEGTGTDADSTAVPSFTHPWDNAPLDASSYPLCNNPTHHPNPTVPSPTHLDATRLESQPIPGGSTALRQAKEANIPEIGTPSPPESAPPTRGSPSPTTTTDPALIPPHATPVTLPSIPESAQTVTLVLNQLVSTEVSHLSSELSLSTANLATNIVRSDQPTRDLPTNEIGDTSQTPTATLSTLSHTDSAPVIVAPSTVPRPTSARKPDCKEQQDIATPHTISGVTQILSVADRNGVALQTSQGSTGVPPTTIPDHRSSLVVMPPPPGGIIPAESPVPIESTNIQPDHRSRQLGSLSSTLTTVRSHLTPQVTSVLDVHSTTRIATLSLHEHDETRDLDPPPPMEASLDIQQQSAGRLTPDIAEDALPPGDDRVGQM